MSSGKATVILADDHVLVRAGIRSLLETLPGIEVMAETGDGQEALSLVEKRQPDLILLDITLPGMNGLEVARRIQQMKLKTRVIMLSMHSAPEYVARALRVGSAGYLLKDAAVSELEKAVAAVLIGREYLSQAIDREVVQGFLKSPASTESQLEVLTKRQREILQLIAEGSSTREIAERLFISVKTVETHRAQLMERLGISDVAGLVRLAVRTGLIATDS